MTKDNLSIRYEVRESGPDEVVVNAWTMVYFVSPGEQSHMTKSQRIDVAIDAVIRQLASMKGTYEEPMKPFPPKPDGGVWFPYPEKK